MESNDVIPVDGNRVRERTYEIRRPSLHIGGLAASKLHSPSSRWTEVSRGTKLIVSDAS